MTPQDEEWQVDIPKGSADDEDLAGYDITDNHGILDDGVGEGRDDVGNVEAEGECRSGTQVIAGEMFLEDAMVSTWFDTLTTCMPSEYDWTYILL